MNIRKRNRNPKGLLIPKRINLFQFSYYHYYYYGIRIINYSNITKNIATQKLAKTPLLKNKERWIECKIKIENNHSTTR